MRLRFPRNHSRLLCQLSLLTLRDFIGIKTRLLSHSLQVMTSGKENRFKKFVFWINKALFLKSTSTLVVWIIKSLIQRNRTYVNATGSRTCALLPVSLPKHRARRHCVSSTDLCCFFTSHVMHFAVFLSIKQRHAHCCRLCLVTATPPPAPATALVEKQLFFFLRAQLRRNASGGSVHICILDCDSLLDCGVKKSSLPGFVSNSDF